MVWGYTSRYIADSFPFGFDPRIEKVSEILHQNIARYHLNDMVKQYPQREVHLEFIGRDPTSEIALLLNLPATDTHENDGSAAQSYQFELTYIDSEGALVPLEVVFSPFVAEAGDIVQNTWQTEIYDDEDLVGSYVIGFSSGSSGLPIDGTIYKVFTGDSEGTSLIEGFDGHLDISVGGQDISIDIGEPGQTAGVSQLPYEFQITSITRDGVPDPDYVTEVIMVEELSGHVTNRDGLDLLDFSQLKTGLSLYTKHGFATDGETGLTFAGFEGPFFGSRFADRFLGSGQEDRLNGGAGDDHMNGRGGNDALVGSLGNDTLFGLEGDDYLFGDDKNLSFNGDDALFGGRGNDYLMGYGGDDYLHGNRGRDTLEGNEGDDRLQGGSGSDRLIGGADNDTLIGGRDGKAEDGARDVFVFDYDYDTGFDRIRGFEDGIDIIWIDSDETLDFEQDILANTHQKDKGLRIDLGEQVIFIEDMRLEDFGASDVILY